MSMKMAEFIREEDGAETCDESLSEQVRVCFDDSPDVWFRRRVAEDENGELCTVSTETEIITNNPEVESALLEIAEKDAKAICILSRIEDGGFHAILGPEIVTMVMPIMGPMEFLLGEMNEEGTELRLD